MTLSIPTVVRNEVRNLPLEWQEWRRHQCLVVFGEPLALVFLQYLVQRLPRTQPTTNSKLVHITSTFTCISKKDIKKMSYIRRSDGRGHFKTILISLCLKV